MKSGGFFRSYRRARVAAAITSIAAIVAVAPVVGSLTAAEAASAFNYGEALQKAVWFYDAQRLGPLPTTNRVNWRGDSFLSDGADLSLNLTGGFADAGDTIKATFPLAHTLTTLAWSLVDNPTGYSTAGQSQFALNNLRWGMDYLIKAHPSANRLVVEVGDPNADHQVWAAAELQTYTRKTYVIDSSCGGSEVAGSAAAAFAASAMVFKTSDPTYSATLLTHARQLYTFADTVRGKYTTCAPVMSAFYDSYSGYFDELVWGALWLYQATGEQAYLTKAISLYGSLPKAGQAPTDPTKYAWTYDWDDKTLADVVMLAKITKTQQYVDDANHWADWLTAPTGFNSNKATYSPGGQLFIGPWGSLRYSSGAAMLALYYSDSGAFDATRVQRMHDFAVRQINYILGDNPSATSYEVGFGTRYIQMPHHRSAHGPWGNNPDQDPINNRHIIYGALIGGPTSANDTYGAEKRSDFQKAEVAIDYNAGFTAALARLTKEYGGTPVTIPTEVPDGPEQYVLGSLNQTGTANGNSFFEIKALLQNKAAWPARALTNGSFRYYFTLDAGQSASAVQVVSNYTQCVPPTGITLFSGNIYYVNVDCSNVRIAPTGQPDFTKETQFRVIFPGTHDYTKDWSFSGVNPAVNGTPSLANHIAVFNGTTKVYGDLPGAVVTPSASPSASPTPSRSASPSASASSSPSASPSASRSASPSASRSASPSASPSASVSPSRSATPSASASPSGSTSTCRITWTVQNDWGAGFTTNVTIANTGTTAINGWTLRFSFGGNQLISQGWSATWAQSGAAVTATNLSWNGSLAPGSSTTAGFNASYTGTNQKPTVFTLNGTTCSVA